MLNLTVEIPVILLFLALSEIELVSTRRCRRV